ncbi:MAG: hypothetical protein JRG79_17530 [Deltaproteobacteria bacterium]|nr:hypothetical protein [Deltaproteobacteria bacterium]
MDPRNWQAHLASAMLRQKSVGPKTTSKEFRAFVKSSPVYQYKNSKSENPINAAILLTVEGKEDINFSAGGFTLPSGLTEAAHLIRNPECAAAMLFCEGIASKQLKQFDIIINAVSDADLYSGLLTKINTLLKHSNAPIINSPKDILVNTRDNLARDMLPSTKILAPRTIRVELHAQSNDLVSQISVNNLHYPILIRPIGSQTGVGLIRLDTENQAQKYKLTGWFYITEFHDFRSSDGYYRKYRCWSIGEQIVPNHLFIGTEWNVHGTSRFENMIKNKWMLDEEQFFLSGKSKRYNDNIPQMIATIKKITGLDYFGVDFGFTQADIPILFEANPTMRSNYPEWVTQFPYTKDVGDKHAKAFYDLIKSKTKNTKNAF